MSDSFARHAGLRRRIDRLSRSSEIAVSAQRITLGHDAIDTALGGGLARAKLHEIVASDSADAASAAGFAAMCARRIGGTAGWIGVGRGDRMLDPHGLNAIGIDPARIVQVAAPDTRAMLRAADDAVRCGALAALIIEVRRDPHCIDLTVSRRLVLGAERSGVTVLLVRIVGATGGSAAATRWAVRAAPSRALPGNAPGPPMFALELLRQRGGAAGLEWCVEWDRDEACFRAPLSGALAAVPPRRSVASGAG